MPTYQTAKVYDNFEVLDLLANDMLADEIFRVLMEFRHSEYVSVELGEVCHLLILGHNTFEISSADDYREFSSIWFTRRRIRKIARSCADFCSEKYLSFLSD